MAARLKQKLRNERKFGWQALNDAQYAAIVGILSGNVQAASASNGQGIYERLDGQYQVTGIPEGNFAAKLVSNPCPGFLLWHRRLKKFALSWTMSLEIFWCYYESRLKTFEIASAVSVCSQQRSILFNVNNKFLCRTDFVEKSISLFPLILAKAAESRKDAFIAARKEYFLRFAEDSLEIFKLAPMADEQIDLFNDFKLAEAFGGYPAIPDKEYRALFYFLRIEYEAFECGERPWSLSFPEISALRNTISCEEFVEDYRKYRKQFRSAFGRRVKAFRAWKIPDGHELADLLSVQPSRMVVVCTRTGRIMLSESQVEELTIRYRQLGVPVSMFDPAAAKVRKYSIVDALSVRYAGFAVGSLENVRFLRKKPWNEIMQNMSTIDFSSPTAIELYRRERFSGLDICIDPRPPIISASLNEDEIRDKIHSRRWACERSVAINGQISPYRPLGPIFSPYVLDRDWLSLRARLATLATHLFTRDTFCFYREVASSDFEALWRVMCQILLVESGGRFNVVFDRFMGIFRFFQKIHHDDEFERFADFAFLSAILEQNWTQALRFFTIEVDLSLKSRVRNETETLIKYQQLIEVLRRRQMHEHSEEADEHAVAAFQAVFQRFPDSEAFLFPALEIVSSAGSMDRFSELIATSKDVQENADCLHMLKIVESRRWRRKNLLSLVDRNPWVPEVLEFVQIGLTTDEAPGRTIETQPTKLLERIIEYLSYAQNQHDRNGWKLACKCLAKCSTNFTSATVPAWWLKMFYGSNNVLRKYQRKFLSLFEQLLNGQDHAASNGNEMALDMEVDEPVVGSRVVRDCTDTTVEMQIDE